MKKNYIVPSTNILFVSPSRALMTSGQTGNSLADYDLLDPSDIVFD